MYLLVGLIFVLVLLAAAEVLARRKGLGSPLLFVSDPDCAYRLAPNQSIVRNGKTCRINSQGMRSEEFSMPRPESVTRILVLGDSVANGGLHLSQEETIPYRLAEGLGSPVETLNPSAPGWAPINELEWLERYGLFESQIVVLVVNEGDLYQPRSWDAVGKFPQFPSRRPVFAASRIWTRYLLPKLKRIQVRDPGTGQDSLDEVAAVASGEAVLKAIRFGLAQGARVCVLYTPMREPNPARAAALQSLRDGSLAAGAVGFVVADLAAPDYVDGIHPSASGAIKAAKAVGQIVRP